MSRSPAETVQRWLRGPEPGRVQLLSILGAGAVMLAALVCGIVALQG